MKIQTEKSSNNSQNHNTNSDEYRNDKNRNDLDLESSKQQNSDNSTDVTVEICEHLHFNIQNKKIIHTIIHIINSSTSNT